jgi:hypothetical protein
MAGVFVCLETESEEPMKCESEQYRYARVEGYRITLTALEERFTDRAINLEEMELAVMEQLAEEALCAPWRTSETERAGCREGMRLAALQFLSQYREAIGNLSLNGPV